MAIGTTIVWNTEPPIVQDNSNTYDENAPLFLACFTAPKGPENLRIVGSDFPSLYGTKFSFATYGQPLLQARRIIASGGRLLCQRLVPKEATYGNLIFAVSLESKQTQEVDENGKKIFIVNGIKYPEDATEVTTAGEAATPSMINSSTTVTWHALSEEDVKDPRVIENKVNVKTLTVEDEESGKEITVYPIFSVTDNGRGNTGKCVRINIRSLTTKSNHQAIYSMTDVEDSVDISSVNFTMDPDVILNDKSYAIYKTLHPQFICAFSTLGYDAFIKDLSEKSGLSVDELKVADLLNGNDSKGKALKGVTISENSVDLSYSCGLELKNGSYGKSVKTNAENEKIYVDTDGNEYPESDKVHVTEEAIQNGTVKLLYVDNDITFGSDKYKELTQKFFKPDEGTSGEDVYNTDIYKIDVIADANYDFETKKNIVELAEFRKDLFYFRDLGLGADGLGLTTFDQISDIQLTDERILSSKFAASYCTSYCVTDPFTAKPDRVTCIYSLVDSIISHFINGRYLPFTGYRITDYIEGTIDFIPKKTPNVDQKELMEQISVNCISFVTLNDFMIETCYTSTDVVGQLNYIQNVLAVEHVIKDIRSFCPMNRTNFIGNDSFDEYADSISENVLIPHAYKFESLSFGYENDEDFNDEFEATLTFSFNKHIQSETFNIFAKD